MKKVLFFNVPSAGHLTPSLPLVEALVSEGIEVEFVTHSSAQASVEEVGAVFRELPEASTQLIEAFQAADPPSFPRMGRLLIETIETVMPHLFDQYRAERPAVIVADTFCPWGYVLGKVLKIPVVVMHATFAFHPSFIPPGINILLALFGKWADIPNLFRDIQRFDQLRRACNRRYPSAISSLWDIAYGLGDTHLVFLPTALQYHAQRFNNAYHFIGSTRRIARDIALRTVPPHHLRVVGYGIQQPTDFF